MLQLDIDGNNYITTLLRIVYNHLTCTSIEPRTTNGDHKYIQLFQECTDYMRSDGNELKRIYSTTFTMYTCNTWPLKVNMKHDVNSMIVFV